MMKVLKSLWFLLLAALVLAAFAYPFSAVPKRFEDRAREMTLERVEEGGASVDERYIEQSVREAVGNNLGVIFRTAFIIAAFSALLVYCVSIRPPHDCGGFNLFNPIYLPLVFVIAVLTGLTLSSVLKARGGAAVNDFYALTSSLPGVFPEGKWAFLPPMLFIVLAFELIFRGVVFSFLEKIHFSVGLVLAPVVYALAVWFMVESCVKTSGGFSASVRCAALAALFIGFVQCVITWRLRSVFPAVFSHLVIAYGAGRMEAFTEKGLLSPAVLAALLGIALLLLVGLPVLGRKVRVLAYDFPFTRHHAKMNNWLYGKLRGKGGNKLAEAGAAKPAEDKPAEAPAEDKPAEEKPAETPAEDKPAEDKPAEAPAEDKPAETPAEDKPAEAPAEDKPAETPAEDKPAETPVEEKPAEAPAEDKPAEAKKEEKTEEKPSEKKPAPKQNNGGKNGKGGNNGKNGKGGKKKGGKKGKK